MAWTPRNIKDTVVQYPNRYLLTEVSPGVYDITPAFGTVTEPGTAINKSYLQPLEDILSDIEEAINYVKIIDTVTSLASTAIDISLPATISYSDYAELKIKIMFPSVTTTPAIYLRLNGLSTSIYFKATTENVDVSSGTASTSITVRASDTNSAIRCVFIDLMLTPAGVAGSCFSAAWAPSALTKVTGERAVFANGVVNLTQLNIVGGADVPVGTRIIVYGVKA
ncbi:MAG: hypothetical protein AB9835_14575 [Eubacteriales bacterium]